MKEKAAPLPTKKPDIVPEAKKVGEAAVDTDKTPTPEPKPKPVEAKDCAGAFARTQAPKPDEDAREGADQAGREQAG